MRVPRVRDTGQFDRDLKHQLNGRRRALDPINVTIWGLITAAVPASWIGFVWGVIALMMSIAAVS